MLFYPETAEKEELDNLKSINAKLQTEKDILENQLLEVKCTLLTAT